MNTPQPQKKLSENQTTYPSSPMELIQRIAESKTEWLKDFIESQKPKPKDKTVAEAYKELIKKTS
ncbi:hypothetical protein U9K52_09930 [Chryseobacterium sp. MHB01]|uniref:hypothetical protein n=1 Tax=Chryseobacterium sp. MHB01 TaxID=3109433 RepID=UPI002AFF71D0|nr:hypothetical protein [Chryseobacterium sp. MHB01]MEA1849231.1 hypothetical protein [Chryseobacterium sp. MHB01]